MSENKRYLLECEIVGREIVNPARKNLVCSVYVSPMNRIRKSDLIGGSQVFGVAVAEDPAKRFCISSGTPSSMAFSLNEQEQAKLDVPDSSMATAILSCNGMRAVLELASKSKDGTFPANLTPNDLKVVGFKAQF